MGKSRHIKSRTQSIDYNHAVKHNNLYSNSTVGFESNQNLQGSGEIDNGPLIPYNGPKPVPKPVKYKINDFLKDHYAEIIVTAILIPLLFEMGKSIISLENSNSMLTEKVNEAKETICQMQSNYVDKELLDAKLQLLQSEVEKSNDANNAAIEHEIEKIKQELEEHK